MNCHKVIWKEHKERLNELNDLDKKVEHATELVSEFAADTKKKFENVYERIDV